MHLKVPAKMYMTMSSARRMLHIFAKVSIEANSV